MNLTKALTMVLTGVMAVSPMQYTNGQIVQPTEEVAEEAIPVSRGIIPEPGTVISSDSAIGGFSLIIDKYYDNVGEEESGDIYVDGVKMKAVHRVPSPYENLAIANVKTYVNIRSGPSTEYEAIGKLYKGCVANVLGYEGEWVKIQSGNLKEGYIRGDYLLIGWDAEEKIEEYCDKVATVNCSVLNVRTGMSTSDTIYDQIPRGESYYVVEEYEEWVKIILSQDDNTGRDHTGYVYKQYVDLSYEFQYAVTKEEEEAQKAAEEAARKAEEARLRKLAEEEAARKKAAEAKKKAEEEAKKQANKSEATKTQDQLQQQTTSTKSDKLRQEIAAYALNFVGNPYKWGGTSLTKGADCSGFVQSIYKQFGYQIPRTSKEQAKSAGYTNVTPDLAHLLPGDLIFYTDKKGVVDHVALYIGNGKIVHAANKKDGIKISSYKTRTPYKARRIIQ